MLCSLLLLWFLLSSFVATIYPSRVEHPYCLLWCLLDLFLKGCLPSYLFSQVYASTWNRNLAAWGTIVLVVHSVCEVPWNISGFRSQSKLRKVLLHPVGIVSILQEPLLLLVAPCCRFCNFVLLLTLFLIGKLLASTSHPALEITLLLWHVLRYPFLLWIFPPFLVRRGPVDL